jgi:serine/threonine protein kinase
LFCQIRFYALEFCQASLDQKFLNETDPRKYRGPMPPDEEVCLQLAKGLAHIHKNRLIHRDLKPHNVLIWVDSTGEKVVMKWADFGLSKQVNERGSHSISGMRGTNNWFPPEIMKIFIEEEKNDCKTTTTTPNIRQRGTVKSDVFRAGLVFGYYLLGGDHPFGSAYDIQLNILKNEPVNLPSKFRSVSYQIRSK